MPAPSAAPLHAGVGRAIITPPIGIPMSGFAGRGPAIAVHDDLYATALALRAGDTAAVVITTDLLFAPEQLTQAVRAEVERRTGVPAAHVFLCASHTHYGPSLGTGPDAEPIVATYTANLAYLLAGAAEAAVGSLAPARLGWGTGECRIGINRRERKPDGQIVLGNNPDGPCDRDVRVVRLDREDGSPLAALASFACHGVCAAHAMREVSADFIGHARRTVESLTGRAFLYLQGACGNINPVEMRHSHEPATRLGLALGGEVLSVLSFSPAEPAYGLAAATETVELPGMTFGSIADGEAAVDGLCAEVARLEAEGADSGSLWWAQGRLRKAQSMLGHARAGTTPEGVRTELAALRLGDVALVMTPCEAFCETGIDVKARAPLPRTCFVGYANGSVGYVPVPAAYPEGGYEVTHASRVGPGAAPMLADACVRLLERLA